MPCYPRTVEASCRGGVGERACWRIMKGRHPVKVAGGYTLTGIEDNRDELFGSRDCWRRRLAEGVEDKRSSLPHTSRDEACAWLHPPSSALLAQFHWHRIYLSVYLSILIAVGIRVFARLTTFQVLHMWTVVACIFSNPRTTSLEPLTHASPYQRQTVTGYYVKREYIEQQSLGQGIQIGRRLPMS